MNHTSLITILDTCSLDWRPQTKNVVLPFIIEILQSIWFSKNMISFEDNHMNLQQSIHNIKVSAYLLGTNFKGCMRSYMCNFRIFKEFNIVCHASNSTLIKEVIWKPRLLFWIKCNIDGVYRSSLNSYAYGILFRDYHGSFQGEYVVNLRISTTLHVDLIGWLLSEQ